MKTATLPAVRVAPAFLADVVSVLAEGERLSEFVEASMRAMVERRRAQAAFSARGAHVRDDALETGKDILAEDALDKLQHKLDAARARTAR